MTSYSIGVALFDFLPVFVAALGLAALARGITRRHPALAPVAWAGALLIPSGGACKAAWKLLIALDHQPWPWLADALFIALAPGFVALAFALFYCVRSWRAGTPPAEATYPLPHLLLWLAVPLVGALVAAVALPGSPAWMFWLLGVTTVANLALLVQAVAATRWRRLGSPVSASLIYSFVASLALAGLARLPPGESSAWLQEGVNLSSQAALAYGLWRLASNMSTPH